MRALMFVGFSRSESDRPFNRPLFDHMCNMADNPNRFASMVLVERFMGDGQFLLCSNFMQWACPRVRNGGNDFFLLMTM